MLELLQRALLPPAIHGRVVYRLATTLQGEGAVFRYLSEMRRAQRLGRDEVLQRQDVALARVLDAARRSPFYRERDAVEGVPTPEGARSRLPSIPLLSKADLQRHGPRIQVEPLTERVIRKSTGGSTGEPVVIVKSADGVAREMAASWMALEWSGIRMGDRAVRFWGTPLTAKRRFHFALADLAMNRIRLSAFDIDEADLAAYWVRCRRFRPKWFYGYASLIHLFAEWIERTGHDGRELGLRTIVPTSEPLTDRQRADLERIFGARVQNEYGCGEVGAMAYECEEGRLHLMTETTLVEVLSPDGSHVEPGESGEVVVTDLTNTAMPLIRYRMGDQAVFGGYCTCGRSSPTLEKISGRVHDVVFTPLGRRWHGEKIDYLMSSIYQETAAFRQYQVVQTSQDRLEVRLVTDGPIPPQVEDRVQAYVSERLDGMRVSVLRVDRTERSPSGKLRLVRNDWMGPGGGGGDRVPAHTRADHE